MDVFIKVHNWYMYLRRTGIAGVEGICAQIEQPVLLLTL